VTIETLFVTAAGNVICPQALVRTKIDLPRAPDQKDHTKMIFMTMTLLEAAHVSMRFVVGTGARHMIRTIEVEVEVVDIHLANTPVIRSKRMTQVLALGLQMVDRSRIQEALTEAAKEVRNHLHSVELYLLLVHPFMYWRTVCIANSQVSKMK
jgi:hypothetical protein